MKIAGIENLHNNTHLLEGKLLDTYNSDLSPQNKKERKRIYNIVKRRHSREGEG